MEHREPVLATVGTMASWVVDGEHLLSFLVSLLTLAWWVRIWLRAARADKPNNNNNNKTG